MFDKIQDKIQSFLKPNNDISYNQFIFDSFKLPIQYVDHNSLDTIVCNDLELDCFDSSSNITPMHHYLLSPSNNFSQNMIKQSYKYYTIEIMPNFFTASIRRN